MVKQCKQAGLPKLEFVNNRGYEFRTILGRDIFTESVLAKLGLNERQLKAVKYIKKWRITNREYRDLAWVKKIDLEKVNFGKGKRSLCKNGHYDSKYKIVVPK